MFEKGFYLFILYSLHFLIVHIIYNYMLPFYYNFTSLLKVGLYNFNNITSIILYYFTMCHFRNSIKLNCDFVLSHQHR